MDARAEHLVHQGLAWRQGQRVIFARDLLDTLRRRELDITAAQVAASAGLPYRPTPEGEAIAGVYRQRLNLASGRFAMIDDGLAFSLVPWSPSLDRHLGSHVSGIARARTIDWSFGRGRGPSVG
jgi:hypothetical protein